MGQFKQLRGSSITKYSVRGKVQTESGLKILLFVPGKEENRRTYTVCAGRIETSGPCEVLVMVTKWLFSSGLVKG